MEVNYFYICYRHQLNLMKKTYHVLFLLPMLWLSFTMQAGIICPDDVTYSCDWYAVGIPSYPEAQATGNDIYLWKKFIDFEYLSNCHEGHIDRVWYIDANDNNEIDPDEASCTQVITITGPDFPVQISWPKDVVLNCLDDDTDYGSPTISAGPCDLMGVTYEDAVFGNSATECYKILRTYTVCNYCFYDDQAPGDDGIWTYTQVIKVIDDDAPIIDNCEDRMISLEGDCKAEVSITKSAYDQGDCPAAVLTWNVTVDLGLDGTIDYRYGPNEPGKFKISPKSNNEQVKITLPDRLDRGYLEMKWTVADGCGNHAGCVEKIQIKDLKPPTPYCYGLLFFTLDGWDDGTLTIPARVWDKGGFDNCGHKLRFSYSEDVNDTLKVVKCGQTGVQLDRIYATDISGNQEFCTVFSYIFDNGSCNFSFGPQGRVVRMDGEELPQVKAIFSNGELYQEVEVQEDGTFEFADMPMMEDLVASITVHDDEVAQYTLAEAKMVSNYILGVDTLSAMQFLAADMNDDKQINYKDLTILTDQIIGKTQEVKKWKVMTDEDYSMSGASTINYPKYDGSFDFTLLERGKFIYQEKLDGKKVIDIAVEERAGKYVFFNPYTISSDGFYIHTPEEGKIDLISKEIPRGTLKWEVQANNLEEAIAKVDVQVLSTDYRSYRINYTETDAMDGAELKDMEEREALLYPSVFEDYFILQGKDLGNIELYDVNGSKVSFSLDKAQDSWRIMPQSHKGLIIVKYQASGKNLIGKVIQL